MLCSKLTTVFRLIRITVLILLLCSPAAQGQEQVLSSSAEPDYPPLSLADANGKADGFAVELTQTVLRAVGHEVRFDVRPWAQIKQDLVEGGLDLLPLVGRTPEREALFDFTVPYLSFHGVVVVRRDFRGISSAEQLPHHRLGVMASDNAEEYLRRKGWDHSLQTTKTFKEAFEQLRRGETDAVVVQDLVAYGLIHALGEDDFRIALRLDDFRQNFCIAVTKGDKELLALLNEGLSRVFIDGTYDKLRRKWLGHFNPQQFFAPDALVQFSQDEQRWIEAHPEVLFTGAPNWLPYEAFDGNGNYIGIVAEHLKLIEQKSGLRFKALSVSSWGESLRMASEGRVAVISGDAADAILNLRFRPVEPYSHNPIVIVTNAGEDYVENLEQIKGRRIAIVKDYGYAADIHRYYPDIGFIEVENIQRGLSGVAEGRLDAMLAPMALTSYHMAELGLHNVKVVGKTPIVMDLTLFVDRDQPLLHSIVEKSLHAISHKDSQAILQRWIQQEYVEKTDYGLLLYLGLLSLAALTVALTWNLSLRRQIERRRKVEMALQRLMDQLQRSEAKFRQLVENSNDIIYSLTPEGVFTFVSPAWTRLLGHATAEVEGKSFTEFIHLDDLPSCQTFLQRVVVHGEHQEGMEYRVRHENGEWRWHASNASPRKDAAGAIIGYDGLARDITERKRQEKLILHQAHYDSLTGLPNRLLAMDRLGQMLRQALRDSTQVAVLFLDLDDFKKVNDSLGHEVGDQLLVQCARRLGSVLRDTDTIGRLGGDEFIVLLGGLADGSLAQRVADHLLAQFSRPFGVGERRLKITASIGIALYPTDGTEVSELLRNSDAAMYHAKQMEPNTYAFFTAQLNQRVSRRLEMEQQLHGALERGEFSVYYQPKIELHSGKVTGAEALLRWHNPALGRVPPTEFIAIAEQTSLVVPLGEYVMREALSACARWQSEFDRAFCIAVNLSPIQVRDTTLVGRVQAMLEQYGIAAKALELEITEGVLMRQQTEVEACLKGLIQLGVHIAMDDFGTGYSSLSYLRSYPFHVLKIDRSFLDDVTVDESNRQLIRAAIAMAHGLNMQVVAEGIETQEQQALLSEMGCDYGQGYLISKPMPEAEMDRYLCLTMGTENGDRFNFTMRN